MFLTIEDVPCDTPTTKAPGPRVKPRYGMRKKSATPVPILRTNPVGFPNISSDPTTAPKTVHKYLKLCPFENTNIFSQIILVDMN